MMNDTIYTELERVLSSDSDFFDIKNRRLKKTAIQRALSENQEKFLRLLLESVSIRNAFFDKIDEILIFDKQKFLKILFAQEFLTNSYTAFRNKIGLSLNHQFLVNAQEFVLDFPYKDAVLKGGQTKEQQKVQEVFYHKVLHKKDIDRLFEPKLFVNWQKFEDDSMKIPKSVSLNDNFLFKGNNLIVLHSILPVFRNKIKLIYIDPPYNTGGDGFNYNDTFNHSSWLVFMKNRLEVARELLTEDGSIWLNIDDREAHYLKVLSDEIFGRENFVINFIWEKKYAPANDARYFSDNHDHILVYAKNKQQFKPNLLPRTNEMNKRYKNIDDDPRGPWKPGGFSVKTYSADYDYPITTPSGKIVYPPKGSCWQTSKPNFEKMKAENRIYFGKNGDAKPQIKQFLNKVKQGTVAKSIWKFDEVGHNQVSRSEILAYFDEFVFATPKPEKLLHRILHLASREGDKVLDFFAGSGTTGAVALKMKRTCILVEQMEYIYDVTFMRMKKVIAGSQAGISEMLNWHGGGSFIYSEIKEAFAFFQDKLDIANSNLAVENIAKEIYNSAFCKLEFLDIDFSTIGEELKNLDLEQAKKIVETLLDENAAYVQFSERNDVFWNARVDDIELSEMFYSLK